MPGGVGGRETGVSLLPDPRSNASDEGARQRPREVIIRILRAEGPAQKLPLFPYLSML